MSKKEKNMYNSIMQNDQLSQVYDNIINDLVEQKIKDDQIGSALLATTSMGFNDLFNILSRMIVNSYVLEKYTNESKESIIDDSELSIIIKKTIDVIAIIGLY